MKKIFYKGILLAVVIVGINMVNPVLADTPPPPPPENGTSGNVPGGGGAPIGEGLLILTALGAAYGSKKWYNNHKKTIAE